MKKLQRQWPEAWYTGSLIVQNHGEDPGHGFLVWDMDEDSPEYVEIPNRYGYYTIDVDGSSLPVRDDISEKPRIRLRVKNTSGAEVRRIAKDVRELYDVQQLSIMRVEDDDSDSLSGGSAESAIGDLTSTSYQNDLIIDYVKRNFPATDDVIGEIRRINGDLNEDLDDDDLINNVKWRPKRFEFSNMFSYGEDNVIDFEKMDGIVGLFSENATGKSSILDAICFCLFDKSTRAYRTDKILNNKSDWFECELRFEIEGEDYVIRREGKKQRDRIPVDVDFYKIKDDGTKISLNGEQRYDTNANIREYVGEFEDFVLTTLSVQNDNTLFIEKSQSERKDILAQFMGVDIFDELYTLARDKSKHIESLLDEYSKSDLSRKIQKCEEEIEKEENRIDSIEEKKTRLENRKSRIVSEIMELNKKMSDTKAVDIDMDRLRKRYVSLRSSVEDIEDRISNKDIRKREIQQAISGLKSYLQQFDEEKLKEEHNKQQFLRDKIDSFESDIRYKKRDLEDAKDERQHLNHQEFDPDCEYCVKRNKQDAQKLEELENEIETLTSDIEKLKKKRSAAKEKRDDSIEEEWSKYKDKKEKKRNQKTKLSQVEIKMSNLRSEKRDKEDEIDDIEERIQEYKDAKDQIEKNKKLDEKIDEKSADLDSIKSQISNLESDLRDAHSSIRVSENEKQQAEENLSKIEGLSTKYQAYEYYMEATKRDGVPYELISRFIPQIEQHINSILSQIVDFGIVLEMDGKDINAYIAYDEENVWALELGSGMEKFVSSLAIRAALTDISNLPRPNFLAIDEGFGNLDSDNMNNVYNLFDYLKTNFKFILVISHIDVMRGAVDDLMEIESGEYSSVTY